MSDTPKIYVEDYVDTFLNQICDKADKEQAGAFLVGKKGSNRRSGVSLYFWARSAWNFPMMKMKSFHRRILKNAEQEKKEYFEEGTMIGWMLCRPGARMVIDTKIFNTHEKVFFRKKYYFYIKMIMQRWKNSIIVTNIKS